MRSFLSRTRFMHTRVIHTRLPLLVSALALLALAPSAAQAQVTLYTSASEFQAASLVSDPFWFDGYASPGGIYYYGHSFNFNGVGFTNSSLKVVSPESGYGDPFGGHQFLSGVAGAPMYLDFSSYTTAFGADFASLGGGPMDITVNYDQTFHFESGATFAGFVSQDPITNISVAGGLNGPAIDGMMLGDAAPVPEASTMVTLGLLLFGLLGAAAARRLTGHRLTGHRLTGRPAKR